MSDTNHGKGIGDQRNKVDDRESRKSELVLPEVAEVEKSPFSTFIDRNEKCEADKNTYQDEDLGEKKISFKEYLTPFLILQQISLKIDNFCSHKIEFWKKKKKESNKNLIF